MSDQTYDFAIVGGGFYGCCLALLLRSISDKVIVLEGGDTILDRASRVNQARIHTGFHYPRSFTTALRSQALHRRFVEHFPDAVVDDFDMLYAIARRGSKVSAGRFLRMYESLGAEIRLAQRHDAALFSDEFIESVFNAKEWSFDYRVLKNYLLERLDSFNVGLKFGAMVESFELIPDGVEICLSSGEAVRAASVFNVTYSMINSVLLASELDPLDLKHEFVEIALVEPPSDLEGLAVTVMDGPFFSIMPYPAEELYSLTHVRYTPHYSWTDEVAGSSPYALAEALPREPRWRHMMMDARKYLPCLGDTVWKKSLFDVKTIPVRNEPNDGRPILVHRHDDAPAVISVMGGKIDNIYDLFDILPTIDDRWKGANLSCLV